MKFQQLCLCLPILRASIRWRGAIAHVGIAAADQIYDLDSLVIHNFAEHWLLQGSNGVSTCQHTKQNESYIFNKTVLETIWEHFW